MPTDNWLLASVFSGLLSRKGKSLATRTATRSTEDFERCFGPSAVRAPCVITESVENFGKRYVLINN